VSRGVTLNCSASFVRFLTDFPSFDGHLHDVACGRIHLYLEFRAVGTDEVDFIRRVAVAFQLVFHNITGKQSCSPAPRCGGNNLRCSRLRNLHNVWPVAKGRLRIIRANSPTDA